MDTITKRGMRTVQKHVELDASNVAWFERTYPKGSFSWLFNMLLEKFRAANETTPADYAAIAAKELTEELSHD